MQLLMSILLLNRGCIENSRENESLLLFMVIFRTEKLLHPPKPYIIKGFMLVFLIKKEGR